MNSPEAERLKADHWKSRDLPGYIGIAGPLWTRKDDLGQWSYGLQITPSHLNHLGVVHGGALTTLVDHAISTVAWEAAERNPCVTVQLDTHFLASVQLGQFAQAKACVTHRTSSLLFMRGHIMVGEKMVLTAQAVMKRQSPAPPARAD